MRQWEKMKDASRTRALMRNELRRAGPVYIECSERLPDLGVSVVAVCEDAAGRYRLPFPVRLVEQHGLKVWAREDGREIVTKIVAWRPAP